MTYVYEVDLSEIIPKLPSMERIQIERDFDRNDALFLCALGFEDRCVAIPNMIAEKSKYKCHESVYFEYSTNPDDNEVNRPELVAALEKFSTLTSPVQCDTEAFATTFRQMIMRSCQTYGCPKITFDISVCSSKLLLLILKILFEFSVDLRLVYSEANIYHPTKEEVEKEKAGEKEEDEERVGLTRGISTVSPSGEHPGSNVDSLPEAIVAFATFSPKRSEAVIAYIDENLLAKPGEKRVSWIVGIPHLPEDLWRLKHVAEINKIPESQSINVSTFDYKEILKTLHKLYKQFSLQYHLNISPLGSKMQSLGVALFSYIEPDVTIIFAPPIKYNASRYSEGCKETWIIDFGRLDKVRDILDEVGMLKIRTK